MGMVHVTSGRSTCTYQDLINAKLSALPKSFIPRTLLKRMSIRANTKSDMLTRKRVLPRYKEVDDALLCLRCATQIYPDLKEIPPHVRYNRARDGDLQLGDVVPDVPIVQLDGLESVPTVLISGSYS